MFRINIRTTPTRLPTTMAMTKTTHTAKRAACGFPAPNSFETRVLLSKTMENTSKEIDFIMEVEGMV